MRIHPDHPALAKAYTIHPKAIRQPDQTSRLLKPVSNNRKLGHGSSVISKGHWTGMPLYALTLTERDTCPRTCQQWDNCFGNNMAFAHRIDHRSPLFYELLSDELNLLTRKYKHGVALRLHVLGDFFDRQYVRWWQHQTEKHPNLHVFGYTAHTPDSEIGQAIDQWNASSHKRVWVRFSNAGDNPTVLVANVEGKGPGVPCPEQTGKTESCLTCGICWTSSKPIVFKEH